MFSLSLLLMTLLPIMTIPAKLGFACCMDCLPLRRPGQSGYIHEKVVKTVQRGREEAREEKTGISCFLVIWLKAQEDLQSRLLSDINA